MFRVLPLGLALAAALFLSACGGSNPKLIPQDRADRLTSTADQIAQRTSDHDCSGAQSALQRARGQVTAMPRSLDVRLRANLNAWLDQIGSRIPQDCKPKAASPTATETPSATPIETSTPTPSPSPTETPTPTPTPSATPTPPPSGGDGQNGNGNGNGNSGKSGGVQPPATGGVIPGNGDG